MATQAELAQELDDTKAQVDKIYTEVTTVAAAKDQRIAELEAALAAGGNTTPAVDVAMANLKAALRPLDDLTPDT